MREIVEKDGLHACVLRAKRLGWSAGRWCAVIVAARGVPHRARVAAALLETAAAEAGRLFRMANGDLVLIAPVNPALKGQLALLYCGGDAPVRWLDLPSEQGALLAYALEGADAPTPVRPSPAGLHRQIAVRLGGGLQPCFQQVSLARGPALMESYVSPHGRGARLGAAALADVLPQLETWTRLDAAPALHVAVGLAAARAPEFAALAAAAAERGLSVGATIPLLEAVADPSGWAECFQAARGAGVALVLDEVSHGALALIDPGAFGPDLVKLVWSAEMIEGGPGLAQAMARTGPDRIVLDAADTETAIRWGLSHGVRRFQGRHVDVMLATGRMAACFAADACTIRQCAERAHATSPAGRVGCRNPARLGLAA